MVVLIDAARQPGGPALNSRPGCFAGSAAGPGCPAAAATPPGLGVCSCRACGFKRDAAENHFRPARLTSLNSFRRATETETETEAETETETEAEAETERRTGVKHQLTR